MASASISVVGSLFLGALVSVAACGGDDNSNNGSTGAAGATSGAAGAAGSSTTAGGHAGAAGSGTTSGSGGSSSSGTGGSGIDAGACPASKPLANDPCDTMDDCRYGAAVCSCIDMGWTCSGGETDAGSSMGCPSEADQPFSDDPCSKNGQVCNYSGNITCTCTDMKWDCQAHAR